jgi:hypothetical protein
MFKIHSNSKILNDLFTFILLISLITLTTFGINNSFLTEDIYFQSFGTQLTLERIDEMVESAKTWEWVGYAILPVIILLRIFYTSVFLFIGIFFTELKAEFGKLFKIALLADFVYVLAGLVKLVILIFFKEVNTLQDLQFQPLSVMEFFNTRSIDPLFVYPLSLINVFEIGYFLVLAWLLIGVISEASEERTLRFGQSLKLVTASYGSGLLLWVLVVMFITLNLS